MICEPDEPRDDNEGDVDEPKKGHGGCGAAQPLIRKEGLKLFVQYKRSKDEDEVSNGVMMIRSSLTLPLGGEVFAARQTPISSARGLHRFEENI